MLLTDILVHNATVYAHKPALTIRTGYRTLTLSYQQTFLLAQDIALFLQQLGIRQGDKVLLLAPNSPYWVSIFWGCLLNGSIVVPLNTQSTADFVKKIAKQTKARLFFKHLHCQHISLPKLATYDIEFITEELVNIKSKSAKFQKPKLRATDTAEILYTSGTTGDPKGVVLTHRNIMSNLQALTKEIINTKKISISSTDKFLTVLPLSHIFAQTVGLLAPFQLGAHIVYAHSQTSISSLLAEYQITVLAVVPEILKILFSSVTHQPLSKHLRIIVCGGAPLDKDLEIACLHAGSSLLQGYGLTETSPVITINTPDNYRLGSVGRPLSNLQIKLAKDGEILVKGPSVFSGYYHDSLKTKQAITKNKWFHTGDLATQDPSGFLYLKGRKKYLILGAGGQNIYPQDIEYQLNKIPQIQDSCVLGISGNNQNTVIHAVLLLHHAQHISPNTKHKNIHLTSIINKVNSQLSSYQHITEWSLWPQLDFPRTAVGKIKKQQVITYLQQHHPLAPKSTILKTPLIKLLADITGISTTRITNKTKLVQQLNIDSLLRIELVTRIEEQFGVIVAEPQITAHTTVAHLQNIIQHAPKLTKPLHFKKWLFAKPIIQLRTLLQSIIFPFSKIFMSVTVRGSHNLQNIHLPVIFMPNHLSYLDSLALLVALPLHIRKHLAFAAATDVLYNKYKNIAWLVEFIFHSFPFPRHKKENIKPGLVYLGRLLDHHCSVVIFPEGAISRSQKLLPLKQGAGLIAVEMGVAIIPVKLQNTNHILPSGKIIPRRSGQVTVTFGKPICFSKKSSYHHATSQIQKLLNKL